MSHFRSIALLVLHFCQVSLSIVGNTSACELNLGDIPHTVGGNDNGTVWPWQIFHSSPFNPPELNITKNGGPLADGLLFFTQSNFQPVNAIEEAAPLIMTDKGELVWNGPISNATNLHVSTYRGSPVLTFWSGLSSEGGNIGHGYGNVTFLDSSYRNIVTVCPKFGLVIPGGRTYPCEADFHESFLTDRDTLIVTAYNATPADLSIIGGPKDGWIFDSLVYEIEPVSQEVLFKWSAVEHVPISQTKFPLQGAGTKDIPFDYFHVNSVATVGIYLLVNARHTWSTYLVSPCGDVEWTLEGETGGDFGPLPDEGRFRWQHHARAYNITESSINILYFNNFNSAQDSGSRPSSGLELQLSLPSNRSQSPKVVRFLSDPAEPIYDGSQGSTQFLENGDALLGYGQIPVIKEYGIADSVPKWTARFGLDNRVQSYRSFKQVWSATPYYSPDLVLESHGEAGGCTIGYVSWNGATSVTAWEIWVGSSQSQLKRVGQVLSRRFETKFSFESECAQVVALEGEKWAGKSDVVCIS